jgi:hypothetical protein
MRTALLLGALVGCAHSSGHSSVTAATAPQSAGAQLTSDEIVAKVRGSYTIGVQRCYAWYFQNRGGHSQVLVSFTVDTDGRATGPGASGVPQRLGECIIGQVARWQFPAPLVAQSFALPIELAAD